MATLDVTGFVSVLQSMQACGMDQAAIDAFINGLPERTPDGQDGPRLILRKQFAAAQEKQAEDTAAQVVLKAAQAWGESCFKVYQDGLYGMKTVKSEDGQESQVPAVRLNHSVKLDGGKLVVSVSLNTNDREQYEAYLAERYGAATFVNPETGKQEFCFTRDNAGTFVMNGAYYVSAGQDGPAYSNGVRKVGTLPGRKSGTAGSTAHGNGKSGTNTNPCTGWYDGVYYIKGTDLLKALSLSKSANSAWLDAANAVVKNGGKLVLFGNVNQDIVSLAEKHADNLLVIDTVPDIVKSDAASYEPPFGGEPQDAPDGDVPQDAPDGDVQGEELANLLK